MKIVQRKGAFGIEILDVDVNHLNEDQLQRASAAQNEHGVIFFRDQKLTCEQYLAFARRWGPVVINRFFERVDGYEEIAQVRKEPTHSTVVGETWHTDHSYDEAPARGSILYAKEVPAQGGDTLFANMYMAYDALSTGLKKTLAGLKAIHSSAHVFGQRSDAAIKESDERYMNSGMATQNTVHPVIITHPESGKQALYVNPQFTVRFEGWTQQESAPLLQYLYQHACASDFVIRFTWQKYSIAFWDNRATWHRALNDYPHERRLMHRITLEGTPLSSKQH